MQCNSTPSLILVISPVFLSTDLPINAPFAAQIEREKEKKERGKKRATKRKFT